ncbi:MAG: transglutaminase domain-containing protein, partial [Halioglobus sp.]
MQSLLHGILDAVIPSAHAADDPLLGATPEFSLEDPYLLAVASELGGDANQIFAFVRDEIGFEAYAGSLRGARGTLWSRAGNAVDKASLLVALLRISGIPAEYVRGNLSDPLAATLIGAMFSAPLRVVGCFDPLTTPTSDPVNDPKLLDETRDHLWVRFNGQDADPSFAGAQLGDTFATESDTFAEMPDALRHKLTVRLLRELTYPSLFGESSQDVAPVLELTRTSAELTGRTLTLGHFIDSSATSAIFSITNNTYTPYLLVSGDSLDSADDIVYNGDAFQEVVTNFPFGSQIATGLFLEIDEIAPDGAVTTYQRTIKDRIGKAARENGTNESLDIDPARPFITPVDLLTIAPRTSRYAGPDGPELDTQLTGIIDQLDELSQAVLSDPGNIPAAIEDQANSTVSRSFIAAARARLNLMAMLSDAITVRIADNALAKMYFDSPAITIFQSETSYLDDDSLALRFGMDLRKNEIRAVAAPGQNPTVEFAVRTNRGLSDTFLESQVLGQFEAGGGANLPTEVSAHSVINAALAQGAALQVIENTDAAALEGLDVPADARAYMSEALAAGKVILAPTEAATIDGQPRFAWYESDPLSGDTIGVLDDGGHASTVESTAVQVQNWIILRASEFWLGMISGLGVGSMFNLIKFLIFLAVTADPNHYGLDSQILDWKNYWGVFFNTFQTMLDAAVNGLRSPAFYAGWLIGIKLGAQYSNDPPLGDFFISPQPLPDFDSLAGGDVAALVALDPVFTLPVAGGAQFPVFRIGIKNLTGDDDTFELDFDTLPAGFTGRTTVDHIAIPAGETAEVGVCLMPGNGVPAPGSTADFSLKVTSVSHSGTTTTVNHLFNVPAITGVQLSHTPSALATSPGVPIQTDLVVQAVGNAPVDVGFNLTLPADLALSGLAPVTLSPGETATQTLTLTPSGAASLNSRLVAQVDADVGALPQSLPIMVAVVVPGAEAAAPAATAAQQLGWSQLAVLLGGFDTLLTNLVGNPANKAFVGQVLTRLEGIIAQLGGHPDIAGFAPALQSARDALASAGDSGAVLSAVNGIGAALDSMSAGLVNLTRFTFDLSLSPNTRQAQPMVAADFNVILQNTGQQAATYDLSVTSLPAGVSASFNPGSISLAPGATTAGNPPVLSLTQTSDTELVAFPFTVTATVQGTAPPIAHGAEASMSVRREVISVVSVNPSPAFGDPGDPVSVSARILNAANRARTVHARLTLKDSSDTTLYTSEPVPVVLSLETSLATVDFGTLDTQALAPAQYGLQVTVTDPGEPGTPIAVGEGVLLVGTPVTATMGLSPDVLAPGDGNTTVSLQIRSQLDGIPPLTLVGQLPIAGGATGVAVRDDLAYVCGGTGINVVDISDPTTPSLVRTVGAASRGCVLQDDLLLVYNGLTPAFTLQVYSIQDDPQTPVLLGTSATINYSLPFDLQATSTEAYVAQFSYCWFLGSNDIFLQMGDLLTIGLNLNDPDNPTTASPALLDVLFNDNGDSLPAPEDVPGCSANGGNNSVWQMAQVNDATVYLASSTATGSDTQSGQGRLVIVDRSDPTQLSIEGQLLLPGMVQATGITIDGDRALVVGSSAGFADFGDTL